jgi:hypothetical protein
MQSKAKAGGQYIGKLLGASTWIKYQVQGLKQERSKKIK